MGFDGLKSLFLPSENSVVHRSFSKNRNELKPDKFAVVATLDLENLTEHDFVTEIEKVTKSFPVLHINNFFRTSASKNFPIAERFFYVKVTAGDSSVLVLIDKYDCTLVAIRNSHSVIFIKGGSEEYTEAIDLMVAKDGVDAKKIRVQGFGLQPEMLSYSRDELMSAVISLEGEYSEHKYDFFQRNISRLQGFVHSAVFPDWNTFMGRVFADSGLTATPSGRMREVIKKWTPLSAFVLTGGNSDLSIAGLPVTLKNISGYLSVVNGRAVMNSGAGEYEDNPWAGKRQSGRKVSAGPVMESSGPGVGVMESAGPVMESAGPVMESAGPGLAVTMKSAGLAVTMKSAGLAVMNSAGAGVVTKNGLLQGRKFLPTIIAANIFKRIVLGY